jgi:hypothetical protein
MLYHLSIDAKDPRHVAQVFAEIWGGTATPFPPVIEGSWIAFAGDERNTAIEVYPRGTELVEGEGDADGHGALTGTSDRSSTHMAIGTKLGQDAIMAIAKREGWPAKYRKRGGVFGVIEMWIEGTRMVEVLTPEMQAEYLGAMTVDNWTGFLKARGVPA